MGKDALKALGNEIAKIISKVDSDIEKEIYIDRISKEYDISKEALFGEINKLKYAENSGIKKLSKPINMKNTKKEDKITKVGEAVIKRENMIISLLINPDINAYPIISKKIKPEDFKLEENQKIAMKLYEHFEKEDNNNILDLLEEQELIDHITSIMADDFEIIDNKKAIDDLISIYEKEKLIDEKNIKRKTYQKKKALI